MSAKQAQPKDSSVTTDTPVMRQYKSIKAKHADSILFFRLGDFYEMFEKDAREASAILNLTLTKRHNIPMCGIPYHAATNYISRLLKAGRKVAICEQISLPQGGRGIAERQVTEIITPGTALEESYLEQNVSNYLVALGRYSGNISFAYIDLSAGEFACTAFPEAERASRLRRELSRLAPREVVVQESLIEEDGEISRALGEREGVVVNRYPDWYFDVENSAEHLSRQFKTSSLRGFGIHDDDPALFACGVLLDYVEDASKSLLPHLRSLVRYTDGDFLELDESAQRNLEIVRNMHDGGSNYTLSDVLDFTRTSMGARKIKSWLLRPLNDISEIGKRHDAVEELYRNQLTLSSLGQIMSGILDLERLAARVGVEKAHAKDLLGIKQSLAAAIEAADLVSNWFVLPGGNDTLGRAAELVELLERSIASEPSILLTEGRMIREGYSDELDALRGLKENSQSVLNSYLDDERVKTGIANLRVKYNKIIGYFIEVTKSNLTSVPDHFIRRQSLVGSERFTTDRLVEMETEINNASEKIVELERELFLSVRSVVNQHVGLLLSLAEFISDLDCLASFARVATARGYTRPQLDSSGRLEIVGGRHAVVEAYLPPGEFVPNGVALESERESFALITGPNMAGKSTYLRQTALIVLMAQAGSFVPAHEAHIGIVDKIFCRVGASDNLARGESTFLTEMNETAYILRTATSRSLVIMDEVGRGTSTNDGLAIAWAVSEALLSSSCKTLFATHFHQLTRIDHKKMINRSMEVAERHGEIVFLKRVKDGSAGDSYGIHVAELAGLPPEVIARAKELLYTIEDSVPAEGPSTDEDAGSLHPVQQVSLFSSLELIGKEIESLSVDTMTPLDALNLLDRWAEELKH